MKWYWFIALPVWLVSLLLVAWLAIAVGAESMERACDHGCHKSECLEDSHCHGGEWCVCNEGFCIDSYEASE